VRRGFDRAGRGSAAIDLESEPMTEQDRPREDDPNQPPGADAAQPPPSPPDDDAGQPRGGPERDFGDSAGYGTGGSALDYHEVGDEDASPIKGKHNPLDDVMKPELRSDPDEG